jgi:hypothetical protein
MSKLFDYALSAVKVTSHGMSDVKMITFESTEKDREPFYRTPVTVQFGNHENVRQDKWYEIEDIQADELLSACLLL